MLTPTDLLSLPASRELDALVAEKVMGWHALRDGHCAECEAMIKEGTLMMSDPQGLVGVVPDYSTSIAAAWEVVEKLCPPNPAECVYEFSLERCLDGCHVAKFGPHESGHIDGSAPLAICRAALKTVSAPIPIHSHGTIRSGKIQGVP